MVFIPLDSQTYINPALIFKVIRVPRGDNEAQLYVYLLGEAEPLYFEGSKAVGIDDILQQAGIVPEDVVDL